MPAPSTPPPFTRTVFFLVRATARWLAHPPAARNAFVAQELRPILARHPEVRLRYFDAEAYSASSSDVLMWQTTDDAAYRAMVEELRETPFWGTYFEIRDIVPCVEDDFARHYRVEGFAAAGQP